MSCKGCFYKVGKNCKAMVEQFEECWAYADKEEGNKRENAIKEYKKKFK